MGTILLDNFFKLRINSARIDNMAAIQIEENTGLTEKVPIW